MQKIFNISIRIVLTIFALLLLAPVAAASNSIVLLVEQPSADNLPITIATTQSALKNFIKKSGSDAEIAVINYSTTADVLLGFSALTVDTSDAIVAGLKTSGSRADSINTASGMERAIALLNAEAKSGNKKVLLVVSDAKISTGDKDLDAQFTEWLTEIISEDAVNSNIDVRWHPITQQANHDNIDAFLDRLNGQRVVLSPEPDLIKEAAAPPPPTPAEQQLELITSQLEKETSANSTIVNEQPPFVEESTIAIVTEEPQLTDSLEEEVVIADQTLVNESSSNLEPIIPAAAEDSSSIEVAQAPIAADNKPSTELRDAPVSADKNITSGASVELDDNSTNEPIQTTTALEPLAQPENQVSAPGLGEKAQSLLTPANIKIAILLAIALAVIFLLKTFLSKRQGSSTSGKGSAEKDYSDSSNIGTAVSSVAAVTTKANAPIITPREPTPPPMPASTSEPIPTPLSASENTADSVKVENESDANIMDEDPMDGTQEVFSEFSSVSLDASPVATTTPDKPSIDKTPEIESASTTPNVDQPDVGIAQPPLEVDPYATVIAEAPDFSSIAGAETILADEPEKPVQDLSQSDSNESSPDAAPPEIDPYATVIADASQLKAYAKKFSNDADQDLEDDDPDRTVLYRPEKDD